MHRMLAPSAAHTHTHTHVEISANAAAHKVGRRVQRAAPSMGAVSLETTQRAVEQIKATCSVVRRTALIEQAKSSQAHGQLRKQLQNSKGQALKARAGLCSAAPV